MPAGDVQASWGELSVLWSAREVERVVCGADEGSDGQRMECLVRWKFSSEIWVETREFEVAVPAATYCQCDATSLQIEFCSSEIPCASIEFDWILGPSV